MRVVDCDAPGCTDRRLEGRDDEELLRSIRKHADTVHPQDKYPDEQLREWMMTAAYTVEKPSQAESL